MHRETGYFEMNTARRKFGEPDEFIKGKVRPVMDAVMQEFIAHSSFVVLATSNATGDCDASPKGGQPGFTKVLDEKTLLIPDIAGNRLFNSYENIESNPKAGLIFMIPGCGLTVRVNGRARVVYKDEKEFGGMALEVFNPDDNARILQGLVLEVDEAYPHCPRAFKFSKLWDGETIERNSLVSSERHWYQKWARIAD
jgi:PPOX class probable FMN-dependent enzyme